MQIENVEVVAASSHSDSSLAHAPEVVGQSLQTSKDCHKIQRFDGLDMVVISLTNDPHYATAVTAAKPGRPRTSN